MDDAVVIGGGPAGLIYAETLARLGHTVTVFEEHSKIGKPDHCAGLLSFSGLEKIRIKPPKNAIQNIVYGAKIYSPKGIEIEIRTKEPKAYVLDRAKFDSFLAEQVEKKGGIIKLSSRVLKIGHDFKHITYKDKKSIRTHGGKIIVNSEGVHGHIIQELGIHSVPKEHKIPAIQYELKNVDVYDELVELYFNRAIANGLFAWIIPIGDKKARVGLASRTSPAKNLKWFVRKSLFKDRFRNSKIIRRFGGIIPITLPIKELVVKNIINIGDTAGQVKATTGGGVIMNGLAARLAAKYSHKYLETNDIKYLQKYPKTWKKYVGLDLWLMYRARKVLDEIPNSLLDKLFETVKETNTIKEIIQKGDMDFQRDAIISVIKNPKLIFSMIKPVIYSIIE